jgi:hypothetical protein
MEDECHRLDVEMAAINTTQPGDRPSYVDYTALMQRERTLLDEKDTIQGELTWLIQTITLLTLHTNNPTADTQVAAVKAVMERKMKRNTDIVSW